MTALSEYDRLEASGLWRARADDQRLEVILSLGHATLVITDTKERHLAHWSIPAITRVNPGQFPALYFPEGDEDETLELAENQSEMIEAIERIRSAVARSRPKPGRVRLIGSLASVAVVAGLAIFWLPKAVLNHTVSVVPTVYRQAIGQALLDRIERVAGAPCDDRIGSAALQTLSARLGGPKLVIMPAGVKDSLRLPGGFTLLNRALIEDYEEPDVAAGYVLAEQTRARSHDPLYDLLKTSGTRASFRMLTTGKLKETTLDAYAETVLIAERPEIEEDALLASFEAARTRSSPYAYALDITGETTARLIENDPMKAEPVVPLMDDADWVRLQGICGG